MRKSLRAAPLALALAVGSMIAGCSGNGGGSGSPTASPSAPPTAPPTPSPTAPPTASPTFSPTASPTATATTLLTASPTTTPTEAPTATATIGSGDVGIVLEGLPAAMLSISGTSSSDMYAVGADAGDGLGPWVLHYDGQRWRRLPTGASGELWWITVAPIDGAFYMSGAGGMVLRYDLSARTFERETLPGDDVTLYGIWGDSSTDLWSVGGNSVDPNAGGVVWHFDGTSWQQQDLSAARPEGVPTLFKVWGRGADDVYAVGRLGVILHFDGAEWSQVESGSIRPLFTVHGSASLVATTGGFFDGLILERTGESFVDRTPAGTPQLNGVFLRDDGIGSAVGIEGTVVRRRNGAWERQDPPANTPWDFHATWIDPDGGVWAVGGDLSIELAQGIVAYGGSEIIGTEID